MRSCFFFSFLSFSVSIVALAAVRGDKGVLVVFCWGRGFMRIFGFMVFLLSSVDTWTLKLWLVAVPIGSFIEVMAGGAIFCPEVGKIYLSWKLIQSYTSPWHYDLSPVWYLGEKPKASSVLVIKSWAKTFFLRIYNRVQSKLLRTAVDQTKSSGRRALLVNAEQVLYGTARCPREWAFSYDKWHKGLPRFQSLWNQKE